ncbi:MAG TPA: hypothetical protein VFA10_10030 [Ktedonobacteraceae bacterium]|nr:hypothetical protein [Ktedonobacteraceae bacterium]
MTDIHTLAEIRLSSQVPCHVPSTPVVVCELAATRQPVRLSYHTDL